MAKQLKYMGLLMSQCSSVVDLPKNLVIKTAKDIDRNGYTFTEGCGAISKGLASHLQSCLGLEFSPSVFQIRYCGDGDICKGIVLVDPQLPDPTIVLRPSMRKARIAGELEDLRLVQATHLLLLQFEERLLSSQQIFGLVSQ